jgi:hypothetical protein
VHRTHTCRQHDAAKCTSAGTHVCKCAARRSNRQSLERPHTTASAFSAVALVDHTTNDPAVIVVVAVVLLLLLLTLLLRHMLIAKQEVTLHYMK